MKKLYIFLVPIILFAKGFMVSDIPLPQTYIQNLDPYKCDTKCLNDYISHDQIFSFLAHATHKLSDDELESIRVLSDTIFNIGAYNSSAKIKIAMLLPYKKIGKYASSTTNATFAYLLSKNNPFMLKSYKIEDESQESISIALKQIKDDGFSYVIAPLTQDGIQNLDGVDKNGIYLYVPTIYNKDINNIDKNLLFGGIDYDAQSRLLLDEANATLVIFSGKSKTGNELAEFQANKFLSTPYMEFNNSVEYENEVGVFGMMDDQNQTEQNTTTLVEKKVIKYFISRRTTNLERYLKDNEKIIGASVMVNTPIIKSGMIMSQLTLYDVNATNVLSTQVNYNPLLLSMTQYIDRKNMIIANSITDKNKVLTETNTLLGNDINYDWINYTTTVGIDYIYSEITGLQREYNVKLRGNQFIYKTELLKPSYSNFKVLKPASFDGSDEVSNKEIPSVN